MPSTLGQRFLTKWRALKKPIFYYEFSHWYYWHLIVILTIVDPISCLLQFLQDGWVNQKSLQKGCVKWAWGPILQNGKVHPHWLTTEWPKDTLSIEEIAMGIFVLYRTRSLDSSLLIIMIICQLLLMMAVIFLILYNATQKEQYAHQWSFQPSPRALISGGYHFLSVFLLWGPEIHKMASCFGANN